MITSKLGDHLPLYRLERIFARQRVHVARSTMCVWMAAAIIYARNQWIALNADVTQGFLNIDNNASERALKRVAIGRKNWLFAGHDAAAENHARLWSLIASAERHGVDPQRYLTSVLAKRPLLTRHASPAGSAPTATAERLAPFLPNNWAKENAGDPIPASN